MTDARLPGEAIPERAQDLIAPGDANDQPILSLEDRLLVALAGRGAQTIDGFIKSAKAAAWEAMDRRPPKWDLNAWPDEALVEAVEGAGDVRGLPAAERQGVSGVDAVLHRERDVRS